VFFLTEKSRFKKNSSVSSTNIANILENSQNCQLKKYFLKLKIKNLRGKKASSRWEGK
jgi:hypothetical protein